MAEAVIVIIIIMLMMVIIINAITAIAVAIDVYHALRSEARSARRPARGREGGRCGRNAPLAQQVGLGLSQAGRSMDKCCQKMLFRRTTS